MVQITDFAETVHEQASKHRLLPFDKWRHPESTVAWDRIEVRRATTGDLEEVAGWLASPSGGRLGSAPILTAVALRKQTAHPNIALVAATRRAENSPNALYAFAVIVPTGPILPDTGHRDEPRLFPKIAQIVVNPSDRRQGLGTAFVHLLACSAFAATGMAVEPYVEVEQTDLAMLQLLSKLPFRLDPEHVGALRRFVYGGYSTRGVFANEFERLRRRSGMTQATAAFYAGVKRSTVAAIEAGRRLPSWQVLKQFATILPGSHEERVRLYLSIGEEPGLFGGASLPSPGVAESVVVDRWVCSDHPGEWSDPERFETTVMALEKGKQRWFFMSDAGWNRIGRHLRTRLVEAADDPEQRKNLRFFVAPEAFTQLDVGLLRPRLVEDATAGVETLDGRIIPFPREQAQRIAHALRDVVLILDGSPAGTVHEGFRAVDKPNDVPARLTA